LNLAQTGREKQVTQNLAAREIGSRRRLPDSSLPFSAVYGFSVGKENGGPLFL
jgi:hypothetical protein